MIESNTPSRHLNKSQIKALGCSALAFVFVLGGFVSLYKLRLWSTDIHCWSNMHCIGNWIFVYAADYDETFPASDWVDNLQPYLTNGEDEGAFRCRVLVADDPTAYGYALNSALAGKKNPQDGQDLQIPIIFETTLTGKNVVSGLETYTRKGRHRGKSYVSYGGCQARSVPDGKKP
jgi:hypothetical protein